MAQTDALIKTLKQQLRAHGKTYADVAEALQLSEASVKRLFAEQNFTLLRLEKICQLLEMDFAELVQAMTESRNAVSQLTREQEQEIVSDLLLLMVTVCIVNGYRYEDLFTQHQLDRNEVMQKLAKLDRLKIIDLLPGNRFKLRIAPNFGWIPNGPIQHFFLSKIEQDFFNSRFDSDTERLLVVNGLLSDTGNGEVQKKMQRLANEFTERCVEDRSIAIDERHGTTLVVAIRQWQYRLFDQYQKSDE